MQYRRAKTPAATYFFTVVIYQRQSLFSEAETVDILRNAFRLVKSRFPFTIDAIVILPDHLHCIWTLPEDDANFSTRWRLIKSEFSRHCPEKYQQNPSESRLKKGEKAIWQRRFWEHKIRDETDFLQHLDYIHYNPVKHQLVNVPKDWQYSSFHNYGRDGAYPIDWGTNDIIKFESGVGCE